MILSFLLYVEAFFDTKALFISTQLWYFLTKNLNNSLFNYFYSFFVSNFFGIAFYQDLIYFLSSFYESKLTRYYHFELINSALLVGYNSIHPPLFYIFLWIILSLSFEERSITLKSLFFLGFIILYWGSLWGVGNAAWGYFWVKDVIELILFIVLVFLVIFLHSPTRIQHFLLLFFIWFSVISILLLLRWGFILTRHSFFSLLEATDFFKFYPLILNRFAFKAFSIVLLYTPLLTFILLWYLLLFLTIIFSYDNILLKKYLFFHSLLVVYIISWLKYQPHNYTIYEIFTKINTPLYGINAKSIINDLNLISTLQHSFKRFVVYLPYYTYNLKVIVYGFTVYITWSRFFVIVISLISIQRFTHK